MYTVPCMQRNINGYFRKLPKLQRLIKLYRPQVFSLQETHLLPIYKCHSHNTLYLDTTLLMLNKLVEDQPSSYSLTPMQTKSVQYNSIKPWPSQWRYLHSAKPLSPHLHQNIALEDLHDIHNFLPSPSIFCINFNAHSLTWDSSLYNARGNDIDNFIQNTPNLITPSQYKVPTHLNSIYGSLSTIDLTLCDPVLATYLLRKTYTEPCDSDYFPILISGNFIKTY